ncbi:MAG: carboxymuconolactone decarboxylase family protein [Dehalococcoidia bacterium]
MARIRRITARDETPEGQRHIFDAIVESRGRVVGPFQVLLNSPELAGRVAHLGAYVRFDSTLSSPVRELAIITTSRELDCELEWSAHAPLARQAGVSEQAIAAVGERGGLDSLNDDEAVIIRYGRELTRDHRVTEPTYRAARERFGERGVVELTATMGYYAMLASVLNAFDIEPLEGGPRLPQ